MRNESERVYKGKKKGELKMKPIIIFFCLSLLLLFAISFVFADAIVNVDQTKSELLKPYIQTGVAAKELPMKHPSTEVIAKGSILGGFDRRDLPWSANILASDGWGEDDPDQYTSMAIGPNGYIYVAYQAMYLGGSDWDVGIAMSTNNGVSWSGNALGSTSDDMYPDVAVDDDGYIWIYMTMIDADPSGEILWAKSDDANSISSFSLSWFGGIAGAGEYYLHPSVDAFGSDGSDLHVFIAWTYDDGSADDVMCFVINDGINSGGWSINTFGEDGETDMHPDVAISTNNVIMANIEDVSGDQELRIWYLDIPGVWGSAGWNIISYIIAGDDDYPSISATGTNAFVAFQNDAGGGNWDIVHGNSDDDGENWDLGSYVANTANIEHYPRVAGLGNATGVVYLERNNVRFRQSANLGQAGTWVPDLASSPERVTDQDDADESARSASLSRTSSWWIVTWADDRNFGTKDLDIYSSRRTSVTDPLIEYYAHTIGGDGIADPGEDDVPLTVTLINNGGDATNVAATLSTADGFITVDATNNPSNFGDINSGAIANNSTTPYSFDVSGACPSGHSVEFTLDITADGSYSNSVNFYVTIGGAAWTVLVYINADNNLNDAGQDDVDEMEISGGSTNNVNIVIQIDGSSFYGGYDDYLGNGHTTARRYLVGSNTQSGRIDNGFIMDLGEVNMGDDATLSNFVNWGVNSYPAARYAVIAWDHGDGWRKDGGLKDFSNDDSHGGDAISIVSGEWEDALKAIKTNLGRNVDLFGFDACLMGMMEVEYAGKDYIDVIVHSEETEPFDGWPYDDWLPGLLSNPNWTARELAERITNDYVASYGVAQTPTMSAVDLDPTYTTLSLALDDFARELINAGGKEIGSISAARSASQDYYISTYIDLYDFADEIDSRDIGGAGSALDLASQAVKDAIGHPPVAGRPLIAEGHKGNGVSGSHGIAIYYPTGSPIGSYSGLNLADNNAWWPFIQGNEFLPNEPILTYDSHLFTDNGNDDNIPDPGEDVEMYVTLRNSGGAAVTDVSATLTCSDACITLGTTSQTYPNINSEATSTSINVYTFSVSTDAVQGRRIVFQLDISAQDTAKADYSNTTTFNWIIGANPLGITLTSFTAISYLDGIHLMWRMESENGSYKFLIKRGNVDNIEEAELIGDVAASGYSSKPTEYSYVDKTAEENKNYYYWLIELMNNGDSHICGPVIGFRNVRTTAKFLKPYPEPFNKDLVMNYSMNRKGFVNLEIYDISGRCIKTLINKWIEPGNYNVVWDGTNDKGRKVARGIYFYKFSSKEYSKKGKMTLMK